MENKTKINGNLLTIITLAVMLLVTSFGIAFAYFTGSNSGATNESGEDNVKTNEAGSVIMDMQALTVSNGELLPGGYFATAVSLKATADPLTNFYEITYHVLGTIDTSTWEGTDSILEWTLYRLDAEINQEETPLITNCKTIQDTEIEVNVTHIYMENCELNEAFNEETKIGSNEFTAGAIENVDVADEVITTEDTPAYYYLIVNYKNLDKNQTTTDSNKDILLKITQTSQEKTVDKTIPNDTKD